MPHDRTSTPTPIGSHESFVSPLPEHFPRAASTPSHRDAAADDHIPATATAWDRFITDRSDSAFHAFAGATGGFMSGIVTCPLDVIKTKLQAQGGFRAAQARLKVPQKAAVYNGMLGTGKVILTEEGMRGLYRGLGPIILGYLPTWAVWFTVYGKAKAYISTTDSSEFVTNFWSSIIAGSCSTLCTNPIWVVKTRLMSQVSATSSSHDSRPPWQYNNTFDAFRKMYKTEGILSFYSGLTPALLGLTHVAVQFPAYEFLKKKFTGQGMGVHHDGEKKSQWIGILSASVLSKIMASSATYPHEVIRTRLQTQRKLAPGPSTEYAPFKPLTAEEPTNPVAAVKNALPRYKGIVTTAKTILREEGWRAFYAGMGTNMMRAVPAATTTMLTYEYVMSYLVKTRSEAQRKSAI
ncbi:hypothetical protein VF21_04846 [Pseudogymnoascus sp. 05NY08]|nr:hypothetical protein VF21_04846 [Pseudogymnoascus sp. 05NY08]